MPSPPTSCPFCTKKASWMLWYACSIMECCTLTSDIAGSEVSLSSSLLVVLQLAWLLHPPGRLSVYFPITNTDNFFRDITPISFRGILIHWLFLMISLPSIHHCSLRHNQVIGQLILMKIKCDKSGKANANLCTKAKAIIEMAEVQRVEKSCLVKSHISTRLRFQQKKLLLSVRHGQTK